MTVFQSLAEYGKLADEEMFAILKTLDSKALSEDVGSYYQSIIGILNHMTFGDYAWLKRLKNNHYGDVVSIAELDQGKPHTVIFQDLQKIIDVRKTIDLAFIEATGLLGNISPENRISYQNFKGEPQDKPLDLVMIHIFNHQTHHRGHISLILDQKKVSNDYSNLIWKF